MNITSLQDLLVSILTKENAALFSSLPGLLGQFIESRPAKEKTGMDEFKNWLKETHKDNHASLIEQNNKLFETIDYLLKSENDEIKKQLAEIMEILKQTQNKETNESQSKNNKKDYIIIQLERNNEFKASPDELREISLKCATNSIAGINSEFKIQLTAVNLENTTIDPLDLAKYESARNELATQLKLRLEVLTSPETYKCLNTYLSKTEDWESVIHSLIKRSEFSYINRSYGKKIDVWRTDTPCLSAPIYLNDDELNKTLTHLNFKSTKDLAFGAGWRDLSDLPREIITKHAIPSIITQVVRSKIDVSKNKSVLNITSWHIGEG